MSDKIDPENLSPPCRFKSCEDWIPDIISKPAPRQCVGCKRFYPDRYRKRKGAILVFTCPHCRTDHELEKGQTTVHCSECDNTWNLSAFRKEE